MLEVVFHTRATTEGSIGFLSVPMQISIANAIITRKIRTTIWTRKSSKSHDIKNLANFSFLNKKNLVIKLILNKANSLIHPLYHYDIFLTATNVNSLDWAASSAVFHWSWISFPLDTFQQGLLGPILNIILLLQFFFIFLMAKVDPKKLLPTEAFIRFMFHYRRRSLNHVKFEMVSNKCYVQYNIFFNSLVFWRKVRAQKEYIQA